MAKKVASLADEVKRQHRRGVPLARWSERRWRELARALGTREPTAELREAIRNMVVVYEKALGMPEPSAEEIHDAAKRLRAVAKQVAANGLQLGFPRTPQTLLMRTLAGIFMRDIPILVEASEVSIDIHDLLTHRPLEPVQLAALAERLAPGAWRYRAGSPGAWALMEFVARLNRLSEALCGVPLRLSVSRNQSQSDAVDTSYSGTLLKAMQLLQPALPRVAGSIAECSTSTLGSRLQAARVARRRPEVPPIP